jgi:glycosyltransferase involved in cell wall biosynthesis
LTPLVSIILTTYNQSPWLRTAIESVLAQTMPDWELLLVDNGSTDDSAKILDDYHSHARIRVARYDTNRYHTVVSNEAIRQSRGKYLCFLYGDDYFLPAKLEKQVARFETLGSEFGCVYCRGYVHIEKTGKLLPDNGPLFRGSILPQLLRHPNMFLPIAPMVRRECCVRYPFNESVSMEGEALFPKIAMRYLFDYIEDRLFAMRSHDRNWGKEIGTPLPRMVKLNSDLFAHPDFPAEHRKLFGVYISWAYRVHGWESIRVVRKYAEGRDQLIESVRYDLRSALKIRTLLGLSLSTLPPTVSNVALDLMNVVFGAPSPPPEESFG